MSQNRNQLRTEFERPRFSNITSVALTVRTIVASSTRQSTWTELDNGGPSNLASNSHLTDDDSFLRSVLGGSLDELKMIPSDMNPREYIKLTPRAKTKLKIRTVAHSLGPTIRGMTAVQAKKEFLKHYPAPTTLPTYDPSYSTTFD